MKAARWGARVGRWLAEGGSGKLLVFDLDASVSDAGGFIFRMVVT